MAEYEDGQIEFAILSLVKDPLLSLIPSLASNVKGIQLLSALLDKVKPDWRDFTSFRTPEGDLISDGTLTGPNMTYGITQEAIDSSQMPDNIQPDSSDNATDLLTSRQKLVTAQAALRLSIKSEFESDRLDEEKAASRRHDYGPVIQKWLLYHARRSAIEAVLESSKAG